MDGDGKRIALLGATGPVGRSIAAAFLAARRPWRAVGRRRARLDALFGADPMVERVVWDTDDPGSMRAALRGVDKAVHLVGLPYHEFADHPVIFRRVLEAAVAERVGHLLLIGSTYPFGLPLAARVAEDHPRRPHTTKGRHRKQQEDLLLAAAQSGAIRGAILRLPDLYGPAVAGSLLRDVFAAVASGRPAFLLAPADVPHEFAYVPDIGPVAVALLDHPGAWGRAWHLGGAGTITPRDVARRAFAAMDRRPRIVTLPAPAVRLLGLVSPLMRELVEMRYLLETPVVLDDAALQGLLGPLPKTDYDRGIRETLAAAGLVSRRPRD